MASCGLRAPAAHLWQAAWRSFIGFQERWGSTGGAKQMQCFNTIFVRLQTSWTRFTDEESGQTLIEYALIVALIGVASIGALAFFGGSIRTLFSDAGSSL